MYFFRNPSVSPRKVCESNSIYRVGNPTIVMKLQFIRIKTELVYIGRRRTTSFNEHDTSVNQNCK